MRILYTGFTSAAVGSERRRSDYCALGVLAPTILREAGHTVDHRAVQVGEPLDYDCAVVELFNCNSMVTVGQRWGAAWAALSLPHLVLLGDWQIPAILRSMTPQAFWQTRLCGPKALEQRAALQRSESAVNELLSTWGSGERPTVLCTFTFGHHEFGLRRKPVCVDPSHWVPRLGEPLPKVREWVFASLTKHDSFLRSLRCRWPVEAYVGDSKVSEAELVKEAYGPAWGVLSHPYDHCGSGWWRARADYAIQTGSILATWNDEIPLPAYRHSILDIEALDDAGLAQLAADQAAQLTAVRQPRAEVYAVLNAALETL